jgi:nitrate/nitrite transport system substrate-binding protein
MRRWGQIEAARTDEWFMKTAEQVYRPEIYREAAQLLIAEGHATKEDFPDPSVTGYREPTAEFIDGVEYDGTRPNAYLEQFAIGLKGDEVVR